MKEINELSEEEQIKLAIEENNAILEQQMEEAKQKAENEKNSKYIQNVYKKPTPEEEMQQLLFIFEGIQNPNLSIDLSDKGLNYFLDSSVDRVGYQLRCNEILGKLGEKIGGADDFTRMLINIRKDPKLQELLVLATRYTDSALLKKNYNLFIVAFGGTDFTGLEGQEAEDFVEDAIATITEDLFERAIKVTGKSEEEINAELDQTHNLIHDFDDNNVFAADYDINRAIAGIRKRDKVVINFRNIDAQRHEFDREAWANENGNMENKLHILLGAISDQLDDYQYAMLLNKISFDQKMKREISDCVKYLEFDQMYGLRYALQSYFTASLVKNPQNVQEAKKLIDDAIAEKKRLAEEIKKAEEEHKKIEEDLKKAKEDAFDQILENENPFDELEYEEEIVNDIGDENKAEDEIKNNNNEIDNQNNINNDNVIVNDNQVQNDAENVVEDENNDIGDDDSEYSDEDDIQRDDQQNIENIQNEQNNQLNDQQRIRERAQQIMNQADQQVNQASRIVNVMNDFRPVDDQPNAGNVNVGQPNAGNVNVGQANANHQNPPANNRANNRPPRNNNRPNQPIIQNTESYDNLSIEDKKAYKEYFYGFENYKEGVSSMAIVLDSFCRDLARTQDNREANFESNDLVEGSDSYKRMARSLRIVKEQLENKNSNPSEVLRNFRELYDAADSYYDSHYGIFGIKGSDRGSDRLRISKDIKKIALVMMNNYNNLCAGLCVMKDENGQIYGKKTYNEAEAKYNEIQSVVKYPLNGESGMRRQPYHDQMNTSSYQLKLRAKVHEISKTFSRKYTYIGTVADYENIKPNMTDLDKAKYFTLKKYMDKAYKPMAEFQTPRDVIDKINGGFIKNEYKELAKNPEFKECMRSHPENGLTEWKKIEDSTDDLINICNRNLDRFRRGFTDFVNSRSDFLTFMEPNALTQDQQKYAKDVQIELSDVIFSKIIRNENNRSLANKMVTKPDKAQELLNCIKEAVIDKFGLTLNKDGRGVNMNKFMRILQNPKITETALRNFNNREAAAARQNQQNPQVQNQNNMHMYNSIRI